MIFGSFKEGEEYDYKLINKEAGFKPEPGGYSQKGIILVPNKRPTAILIKMNLEKNLYGEEYNEDGSVFHYIGEGLPKQGHQKRRGGNRRILDNMDKDVYLFVHQKGQKQGYWIYRGIWRIAGFDDDFETEQLTPKGERQRVYRYRLLKERIVLGRSVNDKETSRFGVYETVSVLSEPCTLYVSKLEKSVDAKGHLISVSSPSGEKWEILVILPRERGIAGQASLVRPATIRDPFTQVMGKTMMISPIDTKEGFYISELRKCYFDTTRRVRCEQITAEEPYPAWFADSGVKAIGYSDYRTAQRVNRAVGWVFSRTEVEKMALCYYLSRIHPFLIVP